MMKICYINPTFLIRRPIAELIERLGDKEQIGIFLPKKPFKNIEQKWHNDNSLKKAKIYSYSAINIPFINFEWPIPITPMFFINLFKIFIRYEVIHMWTYFYINSFFTLLFDIIFKKKLIMTCDTFPGYSFSSSKFIDTLFKIYTQTFKLFLFSVPKIIHLYGNSLIPFAKKIGIKASKLKIIPTGIDLKKFKKTKSIRIKLGFKKTDFVLVYAGLLVPRKGIDIMLKTLSSIKDKNIKLLLVGQGPNKKKYIALTDKLGLKKRVSFLGWRKDIPNILKSCDALFLPSRGEGLPGIVMEAMASKLPIIASKIPCIPDLVEDGKNGYLCKINDINCFVNKINKLKKDKNRLKIISNKGKNKIKKFDWKILEKEYLKIYT